MLSAFLVACSLVVAQQTQTQDFGSQGCAQLLPAVQSMIPVVSHFRGCGQQNTCQQLVPQILQSARNVRSSAGQCLGQAQQQFEHRMDQWGQCGALQTAQEHAAQMQVFLENLVQQIQQLKQQEQQQQVLEQGSAQQVVQAEQSGCQPRAVSLMLQRLKPRMVELSSCSAKQCQEMIPQISSDLGQLNQCSQAMPQVMPVQEATTTASEPDYTLAQGRQDLMRCGARMKSPDDMKNLVDVARRLTIVLTRIDANLQAIMLQGEQGQGQPGQPGQGQQGQQAQPGQQGGQTSQSTTVQVPQGQSPQGQASQPAQGQQGQTNQGQASQPPQEQQGQASQPPQGLQGQTSQPPQQGQTTQVQGTQPPSQQGQTPQGQGTQLPQQGTQPPQGQTNQDQGGYQAPQGQAPQGQVSQQDGNTSQNPPTTANQPPAEQAAPGQQVAQQQ